MEYKRMKMVQILHMMEKMKLMVLLKKVVLLHKKMAILHFLVLYWYKMNIQKICQVHQQNFLLCVFWGFFFLSLSVFSTSNVLGSDLVADSGSSYILTIQSIKNFQWPLFLLPLVLAYTHKSCIRPLLICFVPSSFSPSIILVSVTSKCLQKLPSSNMI